MLLPFLILVRHGASEPPEERRIGIDPESIARVEQADDDPATCWLHVDGGEKPYRIKSSVEEIINHVNYALLGDDSFALVGGAPLEPPCLPIMRDDCGT